MEREQAIGCSLGTDGREQFPVRIRLESFVCDDRVLFAATVQNLTQTPILSLQLAVEESKS